MFTEMHYNKCKRYTRYMSLPFAILSPEEIKTCGMSDFPTTSGNVFGERIPVCPNNW